MKTENLPDERRKIPRKMIAYFTRVFDARSNEMIGNLGDITSAGAMLISHEEIPVDEDFDLRLELSEDVSDAHSMDFGARSIWCEPDLDPTRFNVGFEITRIDEEGLATIKRILATYSLRDEGEEDDGPAE